MPHRMEVVESITSPEDNTRVFEECSQSDRLALSTSGAHIQLPPACNQGSRGKPTKPHSLRCKVHLQWIPAHCRIAGNERADSLAKKGSFSHQLQVSTTFKEIRTILKSNARDLFRQKYGGYRHNHDSLRLLDRKPATIVYRLRTGHCRLRAHLSKLGIAGTPLCECQEDYQTPAHVLQDCPIYLLRAATSYVA